jgi:hypothetical protein
VFRRGHGALYDALADGAVDEDRLRDLLAGQLAADVPLMFGIDATTYPRPNAECSPDRGPHYAPCRCDGDRKVVPGWQFQWVMGLEWGTSSWTLPVDAGRLPEGACPVTTTAGQIRDLAGRLSRRQGPAGRPAPLFILDQGYAAAALTHALGGLEVELLVRIAGDRVFYDGRPGPRKPGPGRKGVHGQRFELAAGAARVRHPEQAVRWTWLLIAAYTQLRLARGLAADLRRPRERRPRPGRPLTPYRVRRSFRHLRDQLGTPAHLPKTTHPGPGRPPGARNTPAPRHRLGSELCKTDALKKRADEKKG